ncbi:MAG: DUF3570 domain-containing protein [Nitrospirota bacterium]
MQLKRTLFWTLLFVLSLLTDSDAQDDVNTEFYIQTFNNNITVMTPVISYDKEISTHTNYSLKLTVDFVGERIAGAGSVDSVSGASRRAGNKNKGYKEDNDNDDEKENKENEGSGEGEFGIDIIDVRKEITFGFNHHIDRFLEAKLGYDFSIEKDYISNTPSITFVRDFFMKNTTLAAGYSRNMDRVNGVYMDSSSSKNGDNYYLSLTQILSPMTVTQFAYSQSNIKGFMPPGTRKVTINTTEFNEVMPDTRIKKAYVARLNQYIPIGASIQLAYRYYADDWNVKSHTSKAAIFKYIGENTLFRINYRYYNQTGAFFYKDKYQSVEDFITSDLALAPMTTHLYGIRMLYNMGTVENSGVDESKIELKYERYDQSVGISGNIVMVALNFTF